MLKLTKHCKIQQKIRLFCIINAMFLDKLRQHFSQGHRRQTQMTDKMLKKSGAFHSATCITRRCMGGKEHEETETKQINLR